jgi:phytoene dehydrogenase-like protein
MADAARAAGAEIRTGADVTRITVRDGRARGVVLADGSELEGDGVVSNVDPRRTFLELIDPIELDPGFRSKARNYRAKGAAAKINLALSSLPGFEGAISQAQLKGRLHIGPTVDYLERAFDASKYGDISPSPYLDITVPSLHDPSLAPAGSHVMSIYMQFAPYTLAGGRSWRDASGDLVRTVMQTLEPHAPGLEQLVVQTQVVTPLDLEQTYGLSGGHILHGEPSLDQLFTMRPMLGWAQYRTPIDRLYLCGAGTHPGGGVTAGSGQNAAREIIRDLKRAVRREES